MKTIGIVAEYNPFHPGHIHQIRQIREQADAIVVITSGYFSQRGLPSLLSLEAKTQLALKHGVDLVIELPACYACQSANYFAKYAIQSLSMLHIDALCFGSETNDEKTIRRTIQTISTIQKDPSTSLNHNICCNLGPNDRLGMHYLTYCDQYGIQPMMIPRNNAFKSATQTRKDYLQGYPQPFDTCFHKEQVWQSYYPYLRTFLLLSPPDYLSDLFLVNEGIEHRLIKAARMHDTYENFLHACISKTYSRARIQRTLLFMLLQITKTDMYANPHFYWVKVAGFNAVGQKLLRANKNSNIITRFQDQPDFLKAIDTKTQVLYNSVMTDPIQKKQVIRYE